MNGVGWVVLILAGVVLAFILYKWLKPYFIKHDTTMLFTGGLGSGKSLSSVKQAIILLRKNRFWKFRVYNFWNVKVGNVFRKLRNKNVANHNKRHPDKLKAFSVLKTKRNKPRLYSNIPIHFKKTTFSFEREWAEMLTEDHLMLIKEITEYSIVLIDEFPQFVNQFMWKEEIVQNNLNEFITFFRHYIAGYLIINAQSEEEIECHFRRKLNEGIWCFNFKKYLFGLFYTIQMCDIMLSDNVSTMTNTYIEENTKKHFGLFPARNTYDTRCYSIRYGNILEKAKPRTFWDNLKTFKVLRSKEYVSPLDIGTTQTQKRRMQENLQRLKISGIKKEQMKDENQTHKNA